MADTTLTGNLRFDPDNTYDIGPSGANRPRDFYLAGSVLIGGSMDVASGRGNISWSDTAPASFVVHAGSTKVFEFGANGARQWRVDTSGHILALSDNAYDIGASSGNRPRNLYAAGGMFSPSLLLNRSGASPYVQLQQDGSTRAFIQSDAANQVNFYDGSGNERLRISSGNILWPNDNTFDIGASGAKRPRTGYFGSGVVVGSDGIKWKASGSNVNVMYASGSEDIQILRHFGTKKSTLLKIWAPNGAVSDREATIALVRGDNDEEFIDIYNNGYPDGDPVSVQYGIRVQRRGTGSDYHDFVFDQDDGAEHGVNIKPMFVLRADRNAEFRAEWVRLPIPDTTSGDPDTTGWDVPEEGRIWFNNKSSPKAVKFWNGSAVKTLSGS